MVQGFNICPMQNEMNRERCVELGIADKVDIVTGAPLALLATSTSRSALAARHWGRA